MTENMTQSQQISQMVADCIVAVAERIEGDDRVITAEELRGIFFSIGDEIEKDAGLPAAGIAK